MPLPNLLHNRLKLPVIAAPMFIVGCPELVIAQCKAGIVGSFPSLNARPASQFEAWLVKIKTALAAHDAATSEGRAAPFAVNLIAHGSNARLQTDLALCVKHEVPIIITSLGLPRGLADQIHSYGGIVLNDVVSNRHARSAINRGADGLIAVAAGAGGHAGQQSPFALVQEIRDWFDGPLALAGCISSGRSILAAQVIGADLAYIGSPFIATTEARADTVYKQMIVDGQAEDIFNTSYFSGVPGNYLRPSIERMGLDPDTLPDKDKSQMDFGEEKLGGGKVWKDFWGAGQGIAPITQIKPVAERIAHWTEEYQAAKLSAANQLF